MQNPYQTLGVNRDATPDQIKQAYDIQGEKVAYTLREGQGI